MTILILGAVVGILGVALIICCVLLYRALVKLDNYSVVAGDISADILKFNKFIINTFQSGLKGLAFGLVASLFFARKQRIIYYSTGFGAGLNFFEAICSESSK